MQTEVELVRDAVEYGRAIGRAEERARCTSIADDAALLTTFSAAIALLISQRINGKEVHLFH